MAGFFAHFSAGIRRRWRNVALAARQIHAVG